MTTPDPKGVEVVRAYTAAAKLKSAAEQVSFNEGVMAASFALGAFIDGMPADTPSEASRLLERAFQSMTRARIKVIDAAPIAVAG